MKYDMFVSYRRSDRELVVAFSIYDVVSTQRALRTFKSNIGKI